VLWLTLVVRIPEQEVSAMTLAIAWKRNPALLLAIIVALLLAVAVVGSAYGNGRALQVMPHACPPLC
jgi:hypothetical protein